MAVTVIFNGCSSNRQTPPATLDLKLDESCSLVLLRVPAGSFVMGDAVAREDARPVHNIELSRPFYLGKYEITQQQWLTVMGYNPSRFVDPTAPVDSAGWDDVKDFVVRLNAKFASRRIRFFLPTEAQWEYACRAGTTTKFSFGDDEDQLANYAWYYANSEQRTHPVGQKLPNAWGFYDMHGNVLEWCADWYSETYYVNSPGRDPTGPAEGTSHVDRGGCWEYLARGCRSGFRNPNSPRRDHYIGLRIAAELSEESH